MMGRLETMKLLIKLGADVNAKNSTGSTPLHAASLNGYGECMELLVDKGAYHPVEPARAAEFFFHFFFFRERFLADFLFSLPSSILGADINQKNVYEYTPLNYADSNSRGHSPIYNTPQEFVFLASRSIDSPPKLIRRIYILSAAVRMTNNSVKHRLDLNLGKSPYRIIL
jgi:hypothetical protein